VLSGVTQRVGHAMHVVTDRFLDDAGQALLFPFTVPGFFAPARERATKDLNRIINGIIRDRRDSGEQRGDLLGNLLQAPDADGTPMSDPQLRDEVMTLFLAGHETPAIALSWTCYLLAQNPAVEEKLVAELREVLSDREPTPDDLPRLRYTEMVI